jgi:hypothetical protein
VTVLNLGVALAADWLLVDAHLLTRVALVTGLVPVLTVLALHQVTRVTRSHRYLPGGSRFPHRQPWSYLVLLVISGLLLWHTLPVRPSPAIARAEPGWTATLGLQPVAQYPFIMRMLGNSASLNRYAPEPDVAVDVITAPELARIQDFAHFVWYPADSPANYRPATIDGPIGVVARSIHSNADTAATPNPTHWFALTWVWQIGDAYQQVTVVANQSGPDQAPPAPEPVTWRGIVLKPAQWLARQRPLGDGVVEERVIAAATRIATRILAAAAPR